MTAPTVVLNGASPADLTAAARLIGGGGVVAIPTDTVYGLAANVWCEAAVRRVFAIKDRPTGQPMPVLLASARDVSLVAAGVPREAWPLIDAFWPGALTLVLPARPSLSSTVRAGGATVAVRVPAGRTVLQLLEAALAPVTGTSANLHGRPPATSVDDIVTQLEGRVDAVLADPDGMRIGIASTVVEPRPGACIVHRRGAIAVEEVRAALGSRVRVQVAT